MSKHYVEKRLKDALEKTGGNAVQARKLVMGWIQEDPKLLYGLTKGHLNGIVAYNIERILSGRADQSEEEVVAPSSAGHSKPDSKENFGLELLKAVAGNNGVSFGLEGYSGGAGKKRKVSQSHIQAIQAMAKRTDR